MGDASLARTLGGRFLQDIPRQIEALRGFLEVAAGVGAERQAHTIKGAAANVSGKAKQRNVRCRRSARSAPPGWRRRW